MELAGLSKAPLISYLATIILALQLCATFRAEVIDANVFNTTAAAIDEF